MRICLLLFTFFFIIRTRIPLGSFVPSSLYGSEADIVMLRHSLLGIAQLYAQSVELPNSQTYLFALFGIQFPWPPAGRRWQTFRGVLERAPEEMGHGP
jgi:hypothetical protein